MNTRMTRRALDAVGRCRPRLPPHRAGARVPGSPAAHPGRFRGGGTVDTIARILANALGPILGQKVIVENQPGGSGSIAATQVMLAEPDGHTLLFGMFSHAVAPALAKLTYDTARDLTAVSQVAGVPLFMFAGGKSPFNSVADAVAAAKAAPNTVSYATGGAGSSGHLAAELFARRAGVTMVHVPFRGSPPAIQSLIAGEVQLLWDTPTAATRSYIDAEADEGARRDDAHAAAGVPGNARDRRGRARRRSRGAGLARRAGARRHAARDHRDAAQGDRAGDGACPIRKRADRGDVGRADGDRSGGIRTFFKSEVTRWTEVANRAGLTVQ